MKNPFKQDTKPKFGVILNNLLPAQFSHEIITELNNEWNNYDGILFVENTTAECVHVSSSIMSIDQCYNYDAVVVANGLSAADKLIDMCGPYKKIFYLWDLEWMAYQNRNYHEFSRIYRNNGLKLVCRSQDHAEMVEKCYNVKASVMERFKIADLYEL